MSEKAIVVKKTDKETLSLGGSVQVNLTDPPVSKSGKSLSVGYSTYKSDDLMPGHTVTVAVNIYARPRR